MEPDQFPTPVSRHLPLARRFEAAIVSELRKARSRRVTCDGANSSAFLAAFFCMPLYRLGSTECKADKDWLAFCWLTRHRYWREKLQAFRQSLEHLGHIEGRDIAI